MITKWIINAWWWMLRLVIPPPPEPPPIIPINPNAPCPSCGNCNGKIFSVQMPDSQNMVLHVCKECDARWFEKPIIKVRNIVHAIPVKDLKS